jgi:murein tripeptide amidase MpaA
MSDTLPFLLQELRDRFVFKLVPMLNPDGVIVGNYRCSLAARDLNRNYRHPRRENFPTIVGVKQMVEELVNKYEVRGGGDGDGGNRILEVRR